MRPLKISELMKKIKIHWIADWSYYVLTILFIILICKTSWPGFMSFDSLDALHEARTGIHWNINCPTIVIWLQGICDRIYTGPGLLFLLQVVTTFIALADILFVAEVSLILGIPFMILFACCPVILGPMLVVWKDVGMMAFFIAATSALLRAQKSITKKRFWCWLSLGWTLLACGFRLNAILVALPIFFALSKIFSQNKPKTLVLYFALLILSTSTTMWFINSFKFKPDITLIDPYPAAFFQAFDILGISALSQQNMLPKEMYAAYDKFTISDLCKDYYPENSNKAFVHVNSGQKPLSWKHPAPKMSQLWQHTILDHPKEYLRHRIKVFRALLAMHMTEPYYLTHPGIDANDFGISFKPSRLTPYVLQYLSQSSRTIFGHPWFYYLIASILFLLCIFFPSYRSGNVLMLLLSAALNILPMFFLAASAELRFNLWSIAAILIALVLVINNLLRRLPDRLHQSYDL